MKTRSLQQRNYPSYDIVAIVSSYSDCSKEQMIMFLVLLPRKWSERFEKIFALAFGDFYSE